MGERYGDYAARNAGVSKMLVGRASAYDHFMPQFAMERKGPFAQTASSHVGQDAKRDPAIVDYRGDVPFVEADPNVVKDGDVHGKVWDGVRIDGVSFRFPG